VTETVYFIDYENVSKVDISHIPAGAQVILFLGANDASVSRTLLTGAVKLGERLKLVEIAGTGKNALDFHIAFYLGEVLTRAPDTECVGGVKRQGIRAAHKALVEERFPRAAG
jgi:hypothetical protein